MTGTGRTIPQLLLEQFIEVIYNCKTDKIHYQDNDEFLSLQRFFMWCCLNPRAEVANDLYDFLTKNSFRITKQGFFVALRNVVTVHGSPELVHTVSNAYNKVKAVWKKNPEDFTVVVNAGEYSLLETSAMYTNVEEECDICEGHGTYNDADYDDDQEQLAKEQSNNKRNNENRFTDAHTRTFDIRVGRVVNMPMEECDWSTADCAHAGLHFTADQIHYVGCGDQSVITLINPMKVVGIGEHKGRCYEYLPIMTVPRNEATLILHDLAFDTLQLDESFVVHELESLADIAKQGFVVEKNKHSYSAPDVPGFNLTSIIHSLESMTLEITKRVVKID